MKQLDILDSSKQHRGPPSGRGPLGQIHAAPFHGLSLRQPWAHIVLHYGKRIENRKWCTSYRGPILLHAAKAMTEPDYDAAADALEDVHFEKLHAGIRLDEERAAGKIVRGGFVGTANLVGVIPPRPALAPIGANRDIEEWYRGHGFGGEWRWHFTEQYGFILQDVQPKPFVAAKGALGLFPVHADPWPNLLAACCLIVRGGCVLVVWNKRYEGWSIPGGLVEEGELPFEAAARELEEETDVRATSLREVHRGPHGGTHKVGRASTVVVFRVDACEGVAREREEGCPVTWMPVEQFLRESPFRAFYAPLAARGLFA